MSIDPFILSIVKLFIIVFLVDIMYVAKYLCPITGGPDVAISAHNPSSRWASAAQVVLASGPVPPTDTSAPPVPQMVSTNTFCTLVLFFSYCNVKCEPLSSYSLSCFYSVSVSRPRAVNFYFILF